MTRYRSPARHRTSVIRDVIDINRIRSFGQDNIMETLRRVLAEESQKSKDYSSEQEYNSH